MKRCLLSVVAAIAVSTVAAFTTPTSNVAFQPMTTSSTTLYMSDSSSENDLLRWARSKRSAEFGDNVVELIRPLGLVLQEDEQGNVYVETVAPKGNAARTGKVREKTKKSKWMTLLPDIPFQYQQKKNEHQMTK